MPRMLKVRLRDGTSYIEIFFYRHAMMNTVVCSLRMHLSLHQSRVINRLGKLCYIFWWSGMVSLGFKQKTRGTRQIMFYKSAFKICVLIWHSYIFVENKLMKFWNACSESASLLSVILLNLAINMENVRL